MNLLSMLFTAAALMAFAGITSAQTFPNRPVRLLVAFAPGGGNDLIARVVAQKHTQLLGQSVIVDNRAGGGGSVGAEIVSTAAPDGHTLLNISAAHAIAQTLYPKLNYSLTRDFAPVTILGSSPLVTVVYNGLPVRTLNELVGWAKQNRMVYASGGIGVISHLSMEIFKVAVGVDGTHVPYKGAGPAATDVASGQVHVMSNTLPSVLSLVKAGRFRAIGIMTEKRNASLPEVPTFIEQGYRDFVMGNWTGIVVPAATPRAIVNRLASDLTGIVRSPDVAKRLTQLGFEPLGGSPEEFGHLIQSEVVRFGKAVKASGVKVDG